MSNDRRDFLKQVGGAAGAAIAVSTMISPAVEAADFKRSHTTGKFSLELDGTFAGWLTSIEGGHATAEVVEEKVGTDKVVRKHLAGVKYEDISIQCGVAMSKAIYQWIDNSLHHKVTRKNGAIVASDYKMQERARLEFFEALITEIGFPACDGASKEPAYMTLKFSPEMTRRKQGDGSQVKGAFDSKHQKQWLPANFRLSIAGAEQSSVRVSKIDAFTIKQKFVENPPGELRDYQKEPANVEIPNLKISVPDSHAGEFYDWHEDFVIKGNNGQDKEKSGILEFLSPNRGEVLLSLELKGLGIFKMAPQKQDSSGQKVSLADAEIYCEELSFDSKQPPPVND